MKSIFLFLSFLFLSLSAVRSQTAGLEKDLAQARQLATTGRHPEAELLYDRLLAQYPNHPEVLIGAGYNYSWNKQHDKARVAFEAVLAIDPKSAEGLVGQGYNYAWTGNYSMAKRFFERLQTLQPGNAEAPKGLGYVYLWAGDGAKAIEYFRDLALKFPGSTEYRIALAQAYLSRNEIKKARLALRSALQIDSANRVAGDLLKSTFGVAAPLELDLWAGYSATEGEEKVSLRTVQLTGQVSQKLRMYLKYDISLTADLAALVRANQEVQALSLGGAYAWDKRFLSRLEYGVRLLPDNVNQQLLSGEQVYFLQNGMLLKAGGFYGWSDKAPKEWMAYGGIRLPFTRWYALEPYYFLSRVEGSPRTESRILLNNQLRTRRGYELNAGLLYGRSGFAPADSNDSAILGSYITAILPVSQVVWGQLSFRYEKTPFTDLTVLAAGIKLRLEK